MDSDSSLDKIAEDKYLEARNVRIAAYHDTGSQQNFKGALKAGATCINDAMKEAAVYAISSMVTEDMLDSEHIIVSALDPRVADVVAQAVADAAKESGVVRE